jgi:hypothetical protein
VSAFAPPLGCNRTSTKSTDLRVHGCDDLDTILAGLTLMPGEAGIAVAERDQAHIRQVGKRPCVVLLIAGLTVAVTTVAMDREASSVH